jgi:hypothetical protein
MQPAEEVGNEKLRTAHVRLSLLRATMRLLQNRSGGDGGAQPGLAKYRYGYAKIDQTTKPSNVHPWKEHD